MAKESIEQKAQRLYESGAVEKVGEGEYRVKGSTGEYRVKDGRCECPAYGRCSHAVAVELAQAAELSEREAYRRQYAEMDEHERQEIARRADEAAEHLRREWDLLFS